MADPDAAERKPGYWFGTVLAATRLHETTADVWDRIKAKAADDGVHLPPGMFSAVSSMRATAASLVYAQEKLAASRPGDAITAGMIGLAPYARSPDARADVSKYHVYVEWTPDSIQEGMPAYGVLSYTGSLPATVDELYDAADLLAESQDAEKYGAAPTVASLAIWAS